MPVLDTLPSSAQSIQFKIHYVGLPFGPFSVELQNQAIAIIPLFSTSEYTLFGGDVSSFAGSMAELRFTAHASISRPNNILLDSINFSPDPVPEPSTWALLSAGLICFAAYIRRRAPR